MNHTAFNGSAGFAMAVMVLAVVGALDSKAQTQPANKRAVFPRQELQSIPLPGRPVATPYVPKGMVNTSANPVNPATTLAPATQPRGTLPSPPVRKTDPALARPFNMDAATAQVLGNVKPFTARAEMDLVVGPPNARDTNTVPLIVAFLDGRFRTDMDLNEVRAAAIPAPTFTSLIAVGISQVVSVVRPDRGVMHLMYPELKGFTDFPLTREEAARSLPISRTDAGRGMAVGQPCVIQKIVLAGDASSRHEATIWLSETRRGFPVQIQWHEPNAEVVFRFIDINDITPDIAVFEPPLSYAKYPDQPMLLQNALQRKNSEARTRQRP